MAAATHQNVVAVDGVSISGATLAALLGHFNSAEGDYDGLLFGRLSLLPAAAPADDYPSSHSPPAAADDAAIVAVTDFVSLSLPCSFSDPLGRVDPVRLRGISTAASKAGLVGWFSARRNSPLRPSMRELALSASLSKTLIRSSDGLSLPAPCVFLLLTTSVSSNRSIHNYDYHAYVFAGGSFQPRSLRIINLGPGLGRQYDEFASVSPLPPMPYSSKRSSADHHSLAKLKQATLDQQVLDQSALGFKVDQLENIVATTHTVEREELYQCMFHRLIALARQVEKSSIEVQQQEKINHSLRSQLAAMDQL